MPRSKLNEDMVRRIEVALDERKQQRRIGADTGHQGERRTASPGRRKDDRESVEAPPPGRA